MPLSKLQNFIRNTEGRILYVNPSDLDATDAITNDGASLTSPFKTLQRALLEAARFSYLAGNDNDITEKTTILLFPGEHLIDNRPGFAIQNNGGTATAVSQSGAQSNALDTFGLNLSSNFDLTQTNNILYKFNSVYGGVIVPRGTSIVGLDLRKTKIRPKYVPNPTDALASNSAIFRITGACYFWQFSIFDADSSNFVYTDPTDFSTNNQSVPTFSHHKLTCFEYADGVNTVTNFSLTDLDMYYAKLSNAYNSSSNRNIPEKYPSLSQGFAKRRPEWEIVGAFATDPINVTSIISGDGATPSAVVTVTTSVPHNLQAGTPIKVRGVNVADYNISTTVQTVSSTNPNVFTYNLPFVRTNLPAGTSAGLSGSSATVTIETDTVGGASPYIFNISLRSVWGMNGMHCDGSKSSGFRSMVVAQFTGVSLQKDDRAFVKYNAQSRTYDNIAITKQTGSDLPAGASSTDSAKGYHLDQDAIYRNGWKPSHIKISNDAFIQIVSVFAIGYNRHFDVRSGGDASITNSNSNFGEFSLSSDGFKFKSFDKDDKGYITGLISPRAVVPNTINVDWTAFDVSKTKTVGISSHLYLFGYNNQTVKPPILIQGYRVGAKVNDTLYLSTPSGLKTAQVYMTDSLVSNVAYGTNSSEKSYTVSNVTNSIITLTSNHKLLSGEKIRIISETGDIPENLTENAVYYAIANDKDNTLGANQLRVASSITNAQAPTPVSLSIYGGTQLVVSSTVSDKSPGELGSPVQWDSANSSWYVHTNTNSDIYNAIQSITDPKTLVSYIQRIEDSRGLDEKLYKFRYVIPKELTNSRDPLVGYVLQESSTTGARTNADFSLTSITSTDYDFRRNTRFISTCSYDNPSAKITVISDTDHNLNVNDIVVIRNVTDTINTIGADNLGFNGPFKVTDIVNSKTFKYSSTDVNGLTHNIGSFTNNTNVRNTSLPRFEKNNNQGNFYIYRSVPITPYIQGVQDGVYHLYVLNSSNQVPVEFTDTSYSQNIVNLYPQMDKDNVSENPRSTTSFAARAPLGQVNTSRIKNSVTRETVDKFFKFANVFPKITGITTAVGIATITFDREHGLSGIVTYSSLSGGSGHTNTGTFYNVKLFNNNSSPSTAPWNGATATVVVSGGSVTSLDVAHFGSGYAAGNVLYVDSSIIGGSPSANITISASGISSCIGGYGQVAGIGTTSSGYFSINGVPSSTQLSIACTSGDSFPSVGQYFAYNGQRTIVTSTTYDSASGISTITCSGPHGLTSGNRIRLLDVNNNSLGDFLVNQVVGIQTFTSKTNYSVSSAAYALKHVLSANEATSDSSGENLGSRGIFIYDRESLQLITDITYNSNLQVKLLYTTDTSTITKRFPLGSYIKVDSEIMRITSSTLTGAGNNEITVIRGAMGTLAVPHSASSLIQKIRLLPIEFRRPSILRASGHTFEYLGYGPGNYSTGLPQLQKKTLSEIENFLAQSQQSSSGQVIYTGMNNNGDVFQGNTKTSASSGQQITFGIPVPTVTGQDPSRLSVIYDEVLIKERLLVEGGNSGTVLSQFNGPVTFNKELKINDVVTANATLKFNAPLTITDETNSSSATTGALIVSGGVGIGGNLTVGTSIVGLSNLSIAGITTISGSLNVSGVSNLNNSLNVTGNASISGITTISNNLNISGVTSATGTINCYGSLTCAGNISGTIGIFTGRVECVTPLNAGTTGGLRIKANTNNVAYLQFTDNAGTNEYANISATNNNVTVSGNLNVTQDITAFYTPSDRNWKNDITPITDALKKVISISGNTFTWNEKSPRTGNDVGVVAQEIQAVLPEAVVQREDGHLSVSYEKLVPLLIESIKELKKEVDELKNSLK